jgi:alpha-1,2-mannosyltransferase
VSTTDARAIAPGRLWFIGLAVVALGAVLAVVRLATQFDYGYDYAVYRAAGSAVVHHQSVFGPWIGLHLPRALPFTYPPLAAVFAVPFALIGDHLGLALWNVASVVALAFVVRASTTDLVRRFARPALALGVVCAIAFVLAPVQEELRYGQLGIVLMAMCFFDCAPAPTRWPRGMLVGAATAIKLVPGIFIPYLWFSGRRRAAVTATATFVALTLAGAAVLPGDSKSFWTSRVFDNSRVGDLGYVSNQSINGMLERAWSAHAHILWIALAAVVAVFGLRRAVLASRHGQEMLGIAIVALVGVLVSPVSWIHHLVWIVPVLAVVVGDATDRRRVIIAASAAALFTLRLPYLALSLPTHWHIGWLRAGLTDADGLVCLALLFVLASLVQTDQRVRRESVPPAPFSSQLFGAKGGARNVFPPNAIAPDG